MHAVVFEVDLKQGWEDHAERELDQVASMVKSVPGFVRGTWANDNRRGLSFIVFESEEAARGSRRTPRCRPTQASPSAPSPSTRSSARREARPSRSRSIVARSMLVQPLSREEKIGPDSLHT